MKIYYECGALNLLKYLIKYGCKNVLISYFSFFKKKDTRNLWEILQGMPRKLEIKDKHKELLKNFNYCMIDSGAYTFQAKSGLYKVGRNNIEANLSSASLRKIDKFTENYGKWLAENKGNYDYYFEMDIDRIVGLEKVEEYRKFLEKCAEKKCIPVWHVNRGLNYWDRMIREYNYVAIGGVVAQEDTRPEKKIRYLFEKAHRYDCKVHVLGFTKFTYLKLIPIDSVDSSTWKMGGRRGAFQLFLDTNMRGLGLKRFQKSSKHIYYKDAFDLNIRTWKGYEDYLEKYWARQKQI